MGTNDMISATCDCGRVVRAPRTLAGNGMKCPVCGVMVMFTQENTELVGPACPHCGKPWPATHNHCPSCMARTRKRSAPPKEAVARKYTDLGGLDIPDEEEESAPELQNEHPDLMAQLNSSEETDVFGDDDDDLADMPQLKAIKIKSRPAELGWKLASGISGIFAVICLITAASAGSAAWGVCGLVYALCAAGLFFGIPLAKNTFIAATLAFMSAYVVIHMIFSPELVSIASAAVSLIATIVMLFGFGTMAVEGDKNINYVFVGGSISAIGAFVMALSFAGIVSQPIDENQTAVNTIKQEITELVGNSDQADIQNNTAEENSSNDAHTNKNTETHAVAAQGDNTENSAIEQTPSAANESNPANNPASGSKYSLSRIMADREAKQQAEEAAKKARESADPSWLVNIKSVGFIPQFPAGTIAQTSKIKIPLSPIYGQTQAEIVQCGLEGLECAAWISDELPESLMENKFDQKDILEAVALMEIGKFNSELPVELEIRNYDLKRINENWFYTAKMMPKNQSNSHTGLFNAQIINNRILMAIASYDNASGRNRMLARKFLQSLRQPSASDKEIENE